MSNNSNNIYNILGKLEALKPTPEEKRFSLVKEIRESVEAQGSITEGVSSVEQKLMEKYMGFDKTVAAIKKGGSADNPEAVAAAIGRKKYGKAKFQKAAAAGKKLGEDYDRVADVKNVAKEYMQANGIQSVHNLEPEDIEYIGGECQCNYADVCEILGCELPDSLGPVDSYDEHGDLEEKAPPGAKAERMVKHIKKSLSKDGHLSDKDKAIAYATTWKAHNAGQVEEETCNECGMTIEGCGCDHTNEGEITRTAGKTVHRKTDYPGYPVDDIDADDDEPRGRGRPRKHAKKEPTGLGRGRPKKAAAVGSTAPKMHDPFGRVAHNASKLSGKKGHVHSMDESMNILAKKLSRMNESINFKRMMEEQHMTLEEMLACMNDDMQQFKETGVCSDRLRDMMEVYSHAKRQMEETQGGIGHDLVTPQQRVAQATPPKPGIGSKIKDTLGGLGDFVTGKPEDPTRPTLEDSLEEELNELARLAGLGEVSRGEYIKQQDTKAEKSGKDKFNAFGQIFNTDEISEEPNEGNEFSGELAKARAQHKDSFNVDGKEYPVKEADVTVDNTDEDELANSPDEEYLNMKASTLNPGEADFGEKNMYGGRGDNKMTQQPDRPARPVRSVKEAILSLEAELAEEYESIKKTS